MKHSFGFTREGGKNLYGVSAETAARDKFLHRPPDLMPPAAAKEDKWQS
jgi:hypothetical protein